jgi:hypothetical protein
MRGMITGREVLRNGHIILKHYGPRCYLRCMLAVLFRERTTFLEVAFRDHCRENRPN